MASPDDWTKVGYDGNPVSGNPAFLEGIAAELRALRDLAGDVDRGLDTLLRTSENGGFEGETADALREYIKKELKTFTANVHNSFDQAGSAVDRYAKALRDAQGKTEDAARRAGAVDIPPAGLVGKNAPPPAELTAARNDVSAEVDFITAEAKVLENALHEAADLVSRPVKKVKRFWKKFWHALEIIAIALTVVAFFFGGGFGIAAFLVGGLLFGKALFDFATGKTSALGLALALLGVLFPSTKGITSFTRALQLLKGGGKLLVRGAGSTASGLGRMFLQGGRLLMLSPRTIVSMTGQNLLRAGRWTGMFVSAIPRGVTTAGRMGRDAVVGSWRQLSGGLSRDFSRTTNFVGGGGRGLKLGVYALLALPRVMANAFLPLRYFEISKFGWGGAFRLAILERGMFRPTSGRFITGAGGAAGHVRSLKTRDSFGGGSGKPSDDVVPPKLVVPGTQPWNDAIDELSELLAPPPVGPGFSGISSLPTAPAGTRAVTPGRIPAVADDLLEPMGLRGLDTAGGPWGSLFQKHGLDTLGSLDGSPLPPRMFRSMDDLLGGLDQVGSPVQRGRLLLQDPDNAVLRLEELDTVMGLERTGTGLLKPIDDLSELASLSIDGKLGGLTREQLLKIVDGEVDLVTFTPDGAILRIGKTEPVDILVGLKGEPTIRVLTPGETGTGMPSLLSRVTGPGTGPALKLDDLTQLIPDTTDGLRQARELFGLSPTRTGPTVQPVTQQTGFPPLTLREIVTGGAVGKTAAERFQSWIHLRNMEIDLDTAGRELTRLAELPDVPPLTRAQAELDLSAAELKLNQARMDFRALGMDPDLVHQNITAMTVRLSGPVAVLPTGELRLLDDLGQPTGQWITLESGPSANWVLRTDAGVVPDTTVRMVDDGFVVTGPEGVFKVGPEGMPASDVRQILVDLARFDGVSLSGTHDLVGLGLRVTEVPATEFAPVSLRIDVTDLGAAGGPVRLPDLVVTPRLDGGGFTVTAAHSGVRWQFDGAGALEFREVRLPGTDLSLRIGDDFARQLPRVVGPDGLQVTVGHGVEFIRTADGGLTVRMPATDALGAISTELRFDMTGALIGRDVLLTGHGMDVLSGMRLRLSFEPGITSTVVSRELVGGGFGTRMLFRVEATPPSLTGRLNQGVTLTEAVGGRVLHFDSAGQLRFRDVPDAEGGFLRFEDTSGTPTLRLDVSGTVVEHFGSDAVPVENLMVSGLDDVGAVARDVRPMDLKSVDFRPLDFGGAPQTRFPLDSIPEHTLPGDVLGERFPLTVIPEESLREVSLSAPGLEGLRLRISEAPGGEALPDVSHLELVDPAGLSMADRMVVEQLDGGGFTIVDTVRDARWELGPQWQPLSLEVRLPGMEHFLRFDLAQERLPIVVGPDAVPAADGFVVQPLRGGSGELTGVTVRTAQTPGAHGPLPEWRFDNGGLLLETRLPVTGPGADPALRGLSVRVIHTSATEAGPAGRTFELIGPSRTTGTFTVAPLTGRWAERLPGGFSLTDSVTGLRWHADGTGRIDLAAGPVEDAPVVDRLGDLDRLGSGADRLSTESPHVEPHASGPDAGFEPPPDLEQIFRGTLREGAAVRPAATPPVMTSALIGGRTDLDSIRGLDDFLHTVDGVAHDPHTAPGIMHVERLAVDARAVLHTSGFDTRLLHGELRGLRSSALARVTGDARQALDAHLTSLTGEPRPVTQAVPAGPDGRPFDVDFTVTPTWGGGHDVVHDLTGLRMEFDAQHRLVSREFFLHDVPAELAGVKVAASDSVTGEGLLVREFTVVEAPGAVDRFVAEPVSPALERTGARFSVVDRVTGDRFHFAPEGTMVSGDVQLGRNLGVLRLDLSEAGRAPQVLDRAGAPVSTMRAETVGGGRLALTPVGESLTRPLQRVVIDSRTLEVTEKTIGVPGPRGELTGEYWKVDYTSRTAVRLDAAGRELRGPLDTAAVRLTPSGEFSLVARNGRILYESSGPGRLVAAVDRSVDPADIAPAEPVWRTTDEPLWRYDGRDPETIFRDGFHAKDSSFLDLGEYVKENTPSGFVSTTVDSSLEWGSRYRYEIHAPSGIDVNKTFDKDPVLRIEGNPFENEAEISFPGGVDPRFVKGALTMKGADKGVWKPNPAFRPEGAEQEWTRQATYFIKAMNQTPAPMATTRTVSLEANVHSVVQMVEQPLHGAPEFTAGINLRMTHAPATEGRAGIGHVELVGPDGLPPQGWSVASHDGGFTVTDPTGQLQWHFDAQLNPLGDHLPLDQQGLPLPQQGVPTADSPDWQQLDDFLAADPAPDPHGILDEPLQQLPDDADLFSFDFPVEQQPPAVRDGLPQLPDEEDLLSFDFPVDVPSPAAVSDDWAQLLDNPDLFDLALPREALPTAAPSQPVASGWSILQHRGAGFTVLDPAGEGLWNLDGRLRVLSQNVQVPGSGHAVSFDFTGQYAPTVLGPYGMTAPGWSVLGHDGGFAVLDDLGQIRWNIEPHMLQAPDVNALLAHGATLADDVPLAVVPGDPLLQGHSVLVSYPPGMVSGPASEFQLLGPAADRFLVGPVDAALEQLGARFSVLSRDTNNLFHFGDGGSPIGVDVWLGQDMGILRLSLDGSGRAPELLTSMGAPAVTTRAMELGGGRIAVVPVGGHLTRPLQHVVIDAQSLEVVEKTVGIPARYGDRPARYWRVDLTTRTATTLDEAGHTLGSGFDPVRVDLEPNGEFTLLGVNGETLYASSGPGRLLAVSDLVDLGRLDPERIVWRKTDEVLWRNDGREPHVIFNEGFRPRDPFFLDLDEYVRLNTWSAFVSTTVDSNLGWGSKFRYEIHVPGGIDANETFRANNALNPFQNEAEISFPGGVHPRFVRRVEELHEGQVIGQADNPFFNPVAGDEVSRRTATYFVRAMNQAPAPMAVTRTMPLEEVTGTVQRVVQITEEPLRGAPELAGMRFRLTETPSTETATAFSRLELVGRDGLPVPGRQLLPRDGGGVTVTGGTRGDLHFAPDGAFEFRDVRLTGIDHALRFDTPAGVDSMPKLLDKDGASVPGARIRRAADGGLTVDVHVPWREDTRLRWQFDETGEPAGQSLILPDRLAVAVDRTVDVDGITPKDLVTWRDSYEPLWRYDQRPPKVIFKEGFAPRDPRYTDLKQLVDFNRSSAFVSTTFSPDVRFLRGSYRYEIHAPGGINADETLKDIHIGDGLGNPHQGEFEISFPGGIRPQFIKGAHQVMDPQGAHLLRDWKANPGFDPIAVNTEVVHAIPAQEVPRILSDAAAKAPVSGPVQVTEELERFANRTFGKMTEYEARKLWDHASAIVSRFDAFPLVIDGERAALLKRDPLQYWHTMRVAQELHRYDGQSEQLFRAVDVAETLAKERGADGVPRGLVGGSPDTLHLPDPSGEAGPSGSGAVPPAAPVSTSASPLDTPDLRIVPRPPDGPLTGPHAFPPASRAGETPGSTVRDVPLSGVRDLRGLGIRITELPATDTAPASVRMEAVDLTANGGPAGLRDVSVTGREGGGFTVTGPQGGVRWQFDATGRLEFRELPLPGTDFSLRFDSGGTHAMPQVVGQDGLPVPGSSIAPPVRDASGAVIGETTVRVPVTGPDVDALDAVFRFDGNGMLRRQDLPLTLPGLDGPPGLGVRVTITPEAGGTATRLLELTGPPHLTGSFHLAPVDGTLAARLPDGFTVTDTVTGSRFHFDADGRLAFRDLPARDGSAFLRHTEGAPDTPPVRLDDLDTPSAEDTTDIRRLFERTMDEATVPHALPENPAADVAGIGGAPGLPHVAPESQAFVTPAHSPLPQLTDASVHSPGSTSGSGPDSLHSRPGEVTAPAHEGIRRQAATALRDYLDLPRTPRLEDPQPATWHTIGDFTVTPTPHGGPGGSHYTVTHTPTDLTTGFGPHRELIYQEVWLSGGPADLDGLRLGMTGRAAEENAPWTPSSFEFVGARPADDTLTITELAAGAPAELRGGFTITDASGTTRWHYGPDGTLAVRDVQLPGDRGLLRFDADGAPDAVPHVLDTAGDPARALRVERLDDGRIALIPTGTAAHPLERAVFDSGGGTLLEETLAIRGKGGRPTGEFWKIDHPAGTAVRTGAEGTPFTGGMFDIATVERSGTGQFRLVATNPAKTTLFEREVLGNGNTLHVDVSRSGHARWTEFDGAGSRFRHGERIGDVDQRTFHDVPSGSWRVLNTVDVRTYTKALDGGLVRAEKGADGHWTWQRFGKDGAEVLSGDRHWSWNHVAFKDTFRDAATGLQTVAQRRGQVWPLDGLHGSRMYQEHAVLPGHFPAGSRIDPGDYTGQGPANAQIERLEGLSDGGSLRVKRFADMRPPAFVWKSAAGRSPFDGFFSDLFTGESLHRVSFWTETAADGTKVTGVRLNPTGSNWVDVDRYGRLVRESRKLENGDVIEVGRSLEDPTKWAPVPEFRNGGSYELHWRNTTTGETGTRHVDGYGRWRDLFTDEQGVQRVRLRSQGKGTREYLHEAPSTEQLRVDDNAGFWVEKNTQQHISGRRDLVDGKIVESHGSPSRTRWTWKEYDPSAPDTVIGEGIRKQNRGSVYSRPWDDSFQDFDASGNLVRERHATDNGSSWIDAVKQGDTWKWTKRAADGTVHSEGVRVHDGLATGRWRDLVDGHEVRRSAGGRVREYQYDIVAPEPPTAPAPDPSSVTLADLLAHSSRHFEPPTTVRVDQDVWKEYDAGKVFREKIAVDDMPGRHRVVDKQWGQWVEFQNGHLVQWRTVDGRVWKTDAFGRVSTSGPVGMPGARARTLIGRETDFRGRDVEIMGHLREIQDVWHGPFTGVRDGDVVEMPMWQRELRSGLTAFATGFVTDFTANLAITAATNNNHKLSETDVFKALLSGGVGGTFNSGLTVLYNHTRLGWLKTRMGTMDWGGHPNQTLNTQADDWAADFTAQDKATRWRNATYTNTVGLATGALSGFVSTAISSAVFGVNGHDVKGWDAMLAGGWGAAGFLFSGVSTGLARNVWHLSTGSRVFHKGGVGELAMNWGESALSRYIAFLIAEEDKRRGNDLPNPGRAFPKAPAAPPPASAPDRPAALTEGMELP